MKIWIGKCVVVIGVIHTIFGFVVFHEIIAALAGEMFLNTIDKQIDRNAAFWFLYTGFAFVIMGGLIDWIERRHPGLPPFLKWSFLSITVLGCVIMPKSGFWLLLIPCIGFFFEKTREACLINHNKL